MNDEWSRAIVVAVRIPENDVKELREKKISLGPHVRELVRELLGKKKGKTEWKEKK